MFITIITILSVILVTLIAVVSILPLLHKKRSDKKLLLVLLSLSAGSLLGGAFIHFLPEALEDGYTHSVSLSILAGFMVFFMLEKLVHWHHNKRCEAEDGHGHAYHLAPMNLIGDGIHNFLDGLIIAASYTVGLHLGIVATITVIFHEIPQEIADFGVLLYSGLSKKKAVLLNLASGSTAIVGAIIGLLLTRQVEFFHDLIVPFAAGNFIYIGASNLVPELHRHCNLKDSLIHVFTIIIGILIMYGLTFIELTH